MGDASAESCVYTSALLPARVSSFGIPTIVASDQGRQAVQIFPLEFTYEPPGYDSQWHHSQYHHQAYGPVERFQSGHTLQRETQGKAGR